MIDVQLLAFLGALVLLGVTAFYGWYTHRLLQELRQQSLLYREVLEKQLKVTAFPHIYCDLQPDFQTGSLQLEVYNVGNIPAYDILVGVIGTYTEETMDIPTFMRNYVQPRFRKYPLQVDKVGYYGVRSSIRFAMLPFQKRLTIALSLPMRPVDIYALVQYREVLGTNYYQVYCFSDLDTKGSYRANVVEPSRVESLDRFHIYDMDDAKVPPANKSLPYPVADFTDLWNHSISYRLTTLYTDETTFPSQPQQQDVQEM
jgi:hypothetical protein